MYQMALLPLFPLWRVFRSLEGNSAHPHNQFQAQRRHFHPPETVTPSRDSYALQRQLRPPERLERPATSSPKRRRRVLRYREGDFVRGGRFCTPSSAVPGTTRTVPPSLDIFTLPRHFHPPETITTSGADSGTKGFEDPAQQKARG